LSLVLALAAMAATILLPGLFGDPSSRPPTWDASIVIACVLEALIALYAALPFFPRVRDSISMAVYPSIAFVLLPYVLAVVLTLVFAAGSVALYATLLSGETIVALAVVGILAAAGNTRRRGERGEAVERASAYKPALAVRAIRDELAAAQGSGSASSFKACADALRRLEERSASATRFGQPGSESDETEIEAGIGALAAKVEGIGSLAGAEAEAALAAAAKEALALVKSLDRRERSLVK
jgi:hypothetical protein